MDGNPTIMIGHSDNTITPMLQTALYYGLFDSTDTLLLRSPPILRHPVITFTPIIQTPRYYGQLLIPTSHYYGHPNNGYHVFTPIVRIPSCYAHPDNTNTQLLRQPRSQGSLQTAISRSVGRLGENPGNKVDVTYGLFPYLAGLVRLAGHEF